MELTVDADGCAVISVSRDSHDTYQSSFIKDYGDTCKNVFQHHYNIGMKPTHPFIIACFEVFHCEIHGMVPLLQITTSEMTYTVSGGALNSAQPQPLLQINTLLFYCLWKWGWGQLYVGWMGMGRF